MLEKFKEEHRDMLSDREIIRDFVEFTVKPEMPRKKRPEHKNPFELMIMIMCWLSIFFNFFYRLQWVLLLVLCIQIFMSFLVFLINMEVDFTRLPLLGLFRSHLLDNSRLYTLLYVVVLYKCDINYFEKYSLVVVQDLFEIFCACMKYWNWMKRGRVSAIQYFGVLVEYFYVFVLSVFVGFVQTNAGRKYAFYMFVLLFVRSRVS